MKTKLTLNLNKNVIELAKMYAKDFANAKISVMIAEEYLKMKK